MTRKQAPTTPQHDAAKQRAALLIIDMINDFGFESGRALHERALATVEPILTLRKAIERAGHPAVYVNDNFGEWHSERSRLVDRALENGSRVSAQLQPLDDDYFIIKPQFSGFYATNLQVLLPKLGVDRLILTGVATDICVLFTAADAHMRDYALWIPENACVAETDERHRWALEIMAQSMGAETAATTDLTLSTWLDRLDRQQPRSGQATDHPSRHHPLRLSADVCDCEPNGAPRSRVGRFPTA